MGTVQGTGDLEMLRRHWGLLATAAVFAATSASAQTAQQNDLDTAKVEQMQRQMQQLQDQMKQVNKDLAEAKKKAAAANGEIPAAFNGAYGADLKPFPTKAPSIIDKVKLTWGGYFSADAVWREHSTLNDTNTSFASIPYPFSPLYGENEFRASARQSRISLLVEGPLSATQKLSGYLRWTSRAPRRPRITTRATAGRPACARVSWLMTTSTRASISLPVRPGAWSLRPPSI
jgi:hypothetical protein